MKFFLYSLLSFSLILPLACFADLPADSLYLQGSQNTAVILCHGRGKHPDWKVVKPLREGLNAQLGVHTLSLQMPNQDKNWKKYSADFPEAYRRIDEAVEFLQQQAGVQRIFLLGHSMGARMASAYLNEQQNSSISGLVVLGCRNNGDNRLDCQHNLQNLELPVLDLWGDGSEKDVKSARQRALLQSNRYQQVAIPGANHRFSGHEAELLSAVSAWIKTQ
jgi:pimeloyl-ACP methyl ester carboxylesterase